MTPNEFAELVASVTAWIGDRALDENLDAGLNANFPANGPLFRSMVDACPTTSHRIVSRYALSPIPTSVSSSTISAFRVVWCEAAGWTASDVIRVSSPPRISKS